MTEEKKKPIKLTVSIDIDPDAVKTFIIENLHHPMVMKLVGAIAGAMANKGKEER